MTDNRPISQIYAEEGKAWAEAEAKASILEDTKASFLSEIILDMTAANPGQAHNKIETAAKASERYKTWIYDAIDARKAANHLKVRLESLRMAYGEWNSQQANDRMVAKI